MTQASKAAPGRMSWKPWLAALAAALTLGACALPAAVPPVAVAEEPSLPPAPTSEDLAWRLPERPAADTTEQARAYLGKHLFFDPRLSGNGTISCATCHNPSMGWADGLKTAIGINGQKLERGTPTVANTAFNTQFMWDGKARSLEEQAMGPMRSAQEMDADVAATIKWLADMPGYAKMFADAFPGKPVDDDGLSRALASFQRTVVTEDSPFDRWLAGDRRALSVQAWRGFRLFTDANKGNCAACHSAPNFTDNGFHNLGLRQHGDTPDLGRYHVKKLPSMKGAFKTSTLRDVELTAPYFHDGSAATLEDVIRHYVRGGDDRGNVSASMKPLTLTDAEQADLVAFLKSLTGRPVPFEVPRLPH